VPSAWTDLDRPPLRVSALRRALAGSTLWTDVRLVESTGSTNADVAAAARSGAPQGLVLVAEHQRGGRGRLDRRWEAPPRSSVLMSVLLRPPLPATAWPLLPLVAGLACVEAVRVAGGCHALLKWPNDVLVDGRKLAGVLVERFDDAAVIGVGLNVTLREAELPVATATSLLLAGGRTDRLPLVVELLRSLERRYVAWLASDGAAAAVLPAYRDVCATLGRRVSLALPSGEVQEGLATGIDDGGRLVVEAADGVTRAWSTGDVVHAGLA
jgi:BirA family biotin operon repressor/biotin-[acetyl-CoA-carboxylase] ligase